MGMEEPAHLSGMIGNVGFDPMGLSTPQNIKWMREAELKHGRMTMLAWAGWVSVDLGIKFPGARYADLSSYKAAIIVNGKSLLDQKVGYEMLLLFLWVGTFETIGFTQIYNMMEGDDDREAGDFGFDPLGLLPGNELQYKTAELTHGRRPCSLSPPSPRRVPCPQPSASARRTSPTSEDEASLAKHSCVGRDATRLGPRRDRFDPLTAPPTSMLLGGLHLVAIRLYVCV